MVIAITAQHLHVALNHIPLIGLAFTAVPLILALCLRQRAVLVAGLLMALLGAGALPLVIESGEAAAARFADPAAGAKLDSGGQQWLAEHAARAESAEPLVYAVLVAALLGLGIVWKWPHRQRIVAGVMLALCVAAVLVLVRVVDAGGRVRHPEFRPPVPPAAATGGLTPAAGGGAAATYGTHAS